MKLRVLCLSFCFVPEDFLDKSRVETLILNAFNDLQHVKNCLKTNGYEVLTTGIALNSFEGL